MELVSVFGFREKSCNFTAWIYFKTNKHQNINLSGLCMYFLISHVNESRLSPLDSDWTGCWWIQVQKRPVQRTLPNMGITGIPLLCVQLPHHILCVHLQLLCQQPFSYGLNILRWYVVQMMLWRPDKCHPCKERQREPQNVGDTGSVLGYCYHKATWTWHCILSFHVFPSPTILCQFCLVSLVQGSEERSYLTEEGHWDFWTICCGLAPWLGPLCAAAV